MDANPPASACSSLPLLLSSPPRARHAPYHRLSCTPRSPQSDKSSRFSARSSASVPKLTSSRSSEWLAAYNEAWEDGTGLDVDPLSEQHVDYFYVADVGVQLSLASKHQQPITQSTTSATTQQQRCLADAFPAEWFTEPVTATTNHLVDEAIVEQQGGERQHQYQQGQEGESYDADDDAYTGRLVGLAMLGLYCTQGVEEASCSANPDVSLPPAAAKIGSPRASPPQRTPSSRARSEFNDVNPHLVSQPSSIASSASPSLSSTPAYLCSPTLSPMTSSPSVNTPAFVYSPASCSPPHRDTISSRAQSATSSALLPPPAASGSLASDQQQRVQFDEGMHHRVCERLRSRLVVDGNTLSDKRSTSSSSSPSSTPTLCVIDERVHHDRFRALTSDDGLLHLSAADLPSPQSWLHLGSYLLCTPRVSSLCFQSVCITSAELEMLGHAALSFIRTLSFTDNSIGLRPYTLSKLVDLLAACEQLELQQLAITHNSLTSIDPLGHVIEQHPTLRSLRLSDNGITNEGAVALASAMQRLAASHHFTDLTSLALCGNRIDTHGVDTLLTARDELQCRTGMEVDVTATDMRQYTPPQSAQYAASQSAPMSPLALLPLSALVFPGPLTQTAFDVSRVVVASHTAHKRLTVFRALSLKVRHAQRTVGQEAEVDEERN